MARFLLLFLVAIQPLQAYVDPGSGALIWQTVLAAGFGLLFYIRRIIGWCRKLWKG